MTGRLTQGKFAPVLESSGALKSEKYGFLAVIFFILFNHVRCTGFIGAPVQFLKTTPSCFSFGVVFYDAPVWNICKAPVCYNNKTHRAGLYQAHGVPMCQCFVRTSAFSS